MERRYRNFWIRAAAAALFFVLLALRGRDVRAAETAVDKTPSVLKSNDLRLITLSDAVSGDSVLMESGGKWMLIDGGDPGSGASLRSAMKQYGVRSVSLFLTHYHSDHYGGILELLQNNSVAIDHLYLPNYRYLTECDLRRCTDAKVLVTTLEDRKLEQKMINLARKRGIPITYLRKGLSFTFGRLTATVLAGCEYRISQIGLNYFNNNSLVTRFKTKSGMSFLSMGDAGKPIQRQLMNRSPKIDATIVSLPHHGYSANIETDFIAAMDPSYVYYTYPETQKMGNSSSVKQAVTRAMKASNVLNTSFNGRITLVINGEVVTARCTRNQRYIVRKRRKNGILYQQKLYLSSGQEKAVVKDDMLVSVIGG